MQITDGTIERVAETAETALETLYLGNPLRAWLVALGIFLGALAVLVAARWLVTRRLQQIASRTATRVDDYLVAILRRTRYFFLLTVAAAAGIQALQLPNSLGELLAQLARLVVLLQLGLWANEFITLYLQRLTSRRTATDVASVTTINALAMVVRLALWVVVLLVALATFGVDVTALITGLGIAGVAVALAVQNVLGDLLASLSIVLDKPFQVGDSITVDNFTGTVEEIGLKTTRLRSLSGEQLVFSNADLLKARIRNNRRMQERRVVFGFGLDYATPPELVERVPGILRELVEAEPQTRFDRAHFQRFGTSSLDFEVVYYMTTADYAAYMDTQQRINLNLMRRLAAMDVEFAFPTQRLYVKGASSVEG
ncbi:MAG TPA: mechanosensitive ion channel family protein [Gemmatimonadaceae bacterium]|nr:mechanosensitive ion channel family protein [Gemmatimonadaceae bacterium]